MATIKSLTDLSQSKKLAEILPLESADMYYHNRVDIPDNFPLPIEWKHNNPLLSQEIPCWSLAALLDILESEIDGEEGETYQLNIEKDGTWWNVWYRERYDEANPIETESTEDLVDACVAMIENLHEQNLL